jgi:formylglycine-generating enzyme required for sulfatase activity
MASRLACGAAAVKTAAPRCYSFAHEMSATLAVSASRSTLAPVVVRIPGGRFRMGSAAGRPDEAPVHEVEVSAFHIGRTPVTRAEYAHFLAATGRTAPPWWSHPAFEAPDQPVVGVTWDDAMEFGRWLGATCGGAWRLPTEAEWEKAARGGLDDAPTAWGDPLPDGEVPSGRLDGPWRVGRGHANGYGLLDVTTVVHEWCLDWYAEEYYAVSPARDPRGPEEGERRASRGGSWRHHVRWSSPAGRSSLPPSYRYADYGFRILKEDA